MKRKLCFPVSFLALSALVGCMPNKAYRAGMSVVSVPPLPNLPSASPQLPRGGPCLGPLTPSVDAHRVPLPHASGPCLAFLEFDDLGESQVVDASGQAAELNRAKDLVRAAILADPIGQPIVMVFVHGWQHNSSAGPPEDSNIQGFEAVLDSLYRPGGPYAGHVVVGISITWRGALVSPYWPVARVLSYYNREAAAMRVGNTSVTDALMQISAIAHPTGSDANRTQPLLIFIGHSFGGLVLERSLSQAFIRQMDEQVEQRTKSGDLVTPFTKFADLVVYVNPAGASSESKPTLDFLARNGITYQGTRLIGGKPENYPLIVSISTPTDAATTTALKAGHALSGVQFESKGSFRKPDPLTCFDPVAGTVTSDTTQSDWDFWDHSTPHLDALKSHDVLDLGGPKVEGHPETCPHYGTGTPGYDVKPYFVAGHCLAVVPREVAGKPACNRTPYWVMETDPSVLPDHGTIFTTRMIGFIGLFLPTANGDLPTLQFQPPAVPKDTFTGAK